MYAVVTALLALLDEVNDLHLRLAHAWYSLVEAVEHVAAVGGGVVPAFQGWGGAAQQHGATGQLSPADGHVPAVVAR